MTVIFPILSVIGYILTVIFRILDEVCLLMTVILTSVTVTSPIYDCDADVVSKSDILLYNPKFPKLANNYSKNIPKLANGDVKNIPKLAKKS